MRSLIILSSILIAGGCAPTGLDDPTFPTGSSALAASDDRTYGVLPEEGVVFFVHPDSGETVTHRIGGEPTRVALTADHLFVSLRAERAVAVLDPLTLEEVARVPTGAEPFGLVASEDGRRLFVAESMAGVVAQLDPETFERVREWAVPGEPRWLALRPQGDSLLVGTVFGGLHDIHLGGGAVHPVPLVWSTVGDGPAPRITGDLAITADGARIAVPVMGEVDAPPSPGQYYGGSPGKIDVGALLLGEFDRTGELHPRVWVRTMFPNGGPLSTIAGVVFDPSGEQLTVSLQGGDAVAVMDAPRVAAFDRDGNGELPPPPEDALPTSTSTLGATDPDVLHGTPAGPRGLAWTPDERLLVLGEFGERVAEIDTGCRDPLVDCVSEPLHEGPLLDTHRLTEEQRRGRSLFYSTREEVMTSGISATSCATCHFEGRTDGSTRPFLSGDWQTPSLAGRVSETTPLTWRGEVESVADEALATTTGRMGGTGPSRDDQAALAAYIDSIRAVDAPLAGSDDPAVERGRVIFESSLAGCSGCHSGSRWTDRQSHAMYGLDAVDTPSLSGVAATPPYLHDGREPTLSSLLRNLNGEMGSTAHLSDAEMDDLEAFLRSL